MRELNGAEVAGFMKETQAQRVRNLRQEHGITPKLLIIKSENASDVIDLYVRMKNRYAEDIKVEVEIVSIAQNAMKAAIERANETESIHGIIIQLPLDDKDQTEELCGYIAAEKDVDGLGQGGAYPSATAAAINCLLAGYSVDLKEKKIAIVGHGKLVGKPLAQMWTESGLTVTVIDEETENSEKEKILRASNVIVTAVGKPGIITNAFVPLNAVIVDAGTASEDGVVVGDVAPEVRERPDVMITPIKGGVGPLTIALLFEHVIQAATKLVKKS